MRIHHINCGTLCPIGFQMLGVHREHSGAMICHVLVIETNDGLVLVDTGFGRGDIEKPKQLGTAFGAFVRPSLAIEETAVHQIEALGFSTKDVRHIVPTHLDLDHAGGLPDFPEAKVHIYARELEAALARATFHEKNRYRPAHFAHGPRWVSYEVAGESWFGFESVRGLEGLPPEILLVPTVGHTRGHVAVAVDTGSGFIVHAGDAYFHRDEMDPVKPSCPLPLRVFQSTMAMDDFARVRNRERLRMLARDEGVTVFCAHDPVEAERMKSVTK